MKNHRLTLMVAATIALLIAAIGTVLGHPLLGAGAGMLPLIGMGQYDDSDIVRQMAAWGVLDKEGGVLKRIKIKTADYTVVAPTTDGGDPSGTIFTTRGAGGAVVFTLPAPAQALAGVYYDFLALAAQNVTVATATADTLIAANDLTADSIAISTSSQKIGAMIRAICDGTSWIAMGMTPGLGADTTTTTYTVAT